MKTATLTALALLTAALLPSCGAWHIGERIRYGSSVHVGAAVRHAGVHYHSPRAAQELKKGVRSTPECVQAPEVTYRLRYPIVESIFEPSLPEPTDLTPTGRQVVVSPYHRFHRKTYPVKPVEPVGLVGVPQKASAIKPFDYMYAHELGELDSPYATRGSLGARIAAAPFDYCIDPALTVVSYTATAVPCACVFVACLPVLIPMWLIDPDTIPPLNDLL